VSGIIGRGGSVIKDIGNRSGARLKISQKTELTAAGERTLFVEGSPECVAAARQLIEQRLSEMEAEQAAFRASDQSRGYQPQVSQQRGGEGPDTFVGGGWGPPPKAAHVGGWEQQQQQQQQAPLPEGWGPPPTEQQQQQQQKQRQAPLPEGWGPPPETHSWQPWKQAPLPEGWDCQQAPPPQQQLEYPPKQGGHPQASQTPYQPY